MPGANDFNRPGAFVTETLTPLVSSVQGVSTQAFPVFAAAYNIGPTGPVLISSWQQYITNYGNFSANTVNSYLPYAVSQFFGNGGSNCYVLRVPNTDATAATLTLQDIKTPTPDNVLVINMSFPGAYGNQIFVQVTSAGNPGRSNITIYQGGTNPSNQVEQFVDMSLNPTDPRNVPAIMNSPVTGSRFVTVIETLPSGGYVLGTTDLALIGPTALTGGADGTNAPNLGSAVPPLLDTLQNTVLNVNLPGVSTAAVLNAMTTWAIGRGDIELVFDGPVPTFLPPTNTPETSAQVVTNYTTMVGTLTASTYATLYAPWVLIQDPASAVPGATRWVPPGGAVLGRWNSTDQQVGVQQTPAGLAYGNLNVLALEATFNPTDLDNLNTQNVNAIKLIPGTGFCIFGGRTLHQNYPDRYISVRRTLQLLEHDMINLTNFAVFLPNAQPLWDQVAAVLTNYLMLQMQAGMFAGTVPTQAFTVTCDQTVNLPSQAQAGILNAVVAVALLSPAEFIIINIQQLQSGTVTTSSLGT